MFYIVFWGCKYILEIKFRGIFLEIFHIKKGGETYFHSRTLTIKPLVQQSPLWHHSLPSCQSLGGFGLTEDDGDQEAFTRTKVQIPTHGSYS